MMAPSRDAIRIAGGALLALAAGSLAMAVRHGKRLCASPSVATLKSLKDFVAYDIWFWNDLILVLGRFTWQAEGCRALIRLRPKPPAGFLADLLVKSRIAALSMVADFISSLTLTLQAESGAEYAYYDGQSSVWNSLRSGMSSSQNRYDLEIIAPASERQISRAKPEDKILVRETPQMHNLALAKTIARIREDGTSTAWIGNILTGKKEANRILYDDQDPLHGFVLIVDPKWKTHPDPSRVPRQSWHHHSSVGCLACLAISRDSSIATLRDLRRRHLPLLRNILERGLGTLQEIYGVDATRIRVYVHYIPQFFHFHVHFSEVGLQHGIEVERAHLLHDIIDRIEGSEDGDYYAHVPISFAVKRSEAHLFSINPRDCL